MAEKKRLDAGCIEKFPSSRAGLSMAASVPASPAAQLPLLGSSRHRARARAGQSRKGCAWRAGRNPKRRTGQPAAAISEPPYCASGEYLTVAEGTRVFSKYTTSTTTIESSREPVSQQPTCLLPLFDDAAAIVRLPYEFAVDHISYAQRRSQHTIVSLPCPFRQFI